MFKDFGEGAEISRPSLKFSFDGVVLDDEFTSYNERTRFMTISVSGRGIVPQEVSLIDIPGMDGALFRDKRIGARTLTVRFLMEAEDSEGFRKLIDRINKLLKNPQKIISFNDEPYTYTGTMVGADDEVETSNKVIRTITLVCADPFKYGEPKSGTLTTDSVVVDNEGYEKTSPVFTMDVTKNTTYALVQLNSEDYMMAGAPYDVDQTPFTRFEEILHDTMVTTSGWSTADTVDNGTIRGTMVSDGIGFVADTYGTVVMEDRWQGPSVKRSFPGSASLQDFRIDAKVEMDNVNMKTGMVEVYLLDNGNNFVGKIGVEDRQPARQAAFGKARAGDASQGEWIIAEESSGWNDFDGGLRLSREGESWVAYIYQIQPDGTHTDRRYVSVTLDEQYSLNPVTQVQVAIRKYPDTDEAFMRVSDIKVYRINQPTEDDVPYIAYAGDRIVFDHESETVEINGEPRTDLKNFGANYFMLPEGMSQVTQDPPDTFNTTLTFRERYR